MFDPLSYQRLKELETIVNQLESAEAFNSRSDSDLKGFPFTNSDHEILIEHTGSKGNTAPVLNKLHWRPVC